jgi:glycosyltransferase involved in cell wall biosynthesis
VTARRPINLFYAEPEGDRWLPFDRYPRRIIRRIVHGPPRAIGQKMVFLNLCAGLRKLGVPFRVNDHRHARRNPSELVCIVGKPFLLDKHEWKNPILFGASVFSHPCDDPRLLERLPVRRILVPGPWIEAMFREHYPADKVFMWPAGIDTEKWKPAPQAKDLDFLVYFKLRWDKPRLEAEFLAPLLAELDRRGLTHHVIRYGQHRAPDFLAGLHRARAMIFLCEHETQGLAYQEALATGVPLLSWRGTDVWVDPEYHPERVTYGPVSATPYWDDRCGVQFPGVAGFPAALDEFLARLPEFRPREFILDGLTLEQSARMYLEHHDAVSG